jgi:hypothetical protein
LLNLSDRLTSLGDHVDTSDRNSGIMNNKAQLVITEIAHRHSNAR